MIHLNPDDFTRALADSTRLRIIVLLNQGAELCVCELTEALQISQPKISRHLATLRESELIQARREGQWVYYQLHQQLPEWAMEVIASVAKGCIGQPSYDADLVWLSKRIGNPCN